nr:thymidylate kinase isoform X2 [Equus caballus]
MAVAIFVRGRALGLRGRAAPRGAKGGAGALTIHEPRALIGPPGAGRWPATPSGFRSAGCARRCAGAGRRGSGGASGEGGGPYGAQCARDQGPQARTPCFCPLRQALGATWPRGPAVRFPPEVRAYVRAPWVVGAQSGCPRGDERGPGTQRVRESARMRAGDRAASGVGGQPLQPLCPPWPARASGKGLLMPPPDRGTKEQLTTTLERSTDIGKLLSSYLEKKNEMENHSVHLLFSANRWEQVPLIKEKLSQGVTLIVDRYAFSGVAYTSAKADFSLDWCKQPDVGLPKPDLVVFLQLQLAEAAMRGEFGRERYENRTFQESVSQRFHQLMGDTTLNWKMVDASQSIEDVHKEIRELSEDTIQAAAQRPLGELWK